MDITYFALSMFRFNRADGYITSIVCSEDDKNWVYSALIIGKLEKEASIMYFGSTLTTDIIVASEEYWFNLIGATQYNENLITYDFTINFLHGTGFI